MARKFSRNGLKVGVRSYFSVGRPPVKFHRVRSPFDAPTYNYSGTAAGLMSDVFGLQKLLSGPLSLFSPLSLAIAHLVHPPTPLRVRSRPMRSHGPKTPLCTVHRPLTCTPETSPDPTQEVVTVVSEPSPNIYKTSPFSYLESLAILSAIVRLRS